MPIAGEDIEGYFEALLGVAEENQSLLDALDAVAADGDHGATFVLAWRAVVAGTRSADCTGASPETVLIRAAENFASVGGSIGPLWGTALLRAGKSVAGRSSIDCVAAVEALSAGLEGIRARGGAEVGDKTLLDALDPAVEMFRASIGSGAEPIEALNSAIEAARAGALGTRALVTRRGRARRLGERTLGHVDAGAASAYLAWATAGVAAGLASETDVAPFLSQ
jgi:phosphoenolpyruvate---glycerone phosphotransferase subunit DhaL